MAISTKQHFLWGSQGCVTAHRGPWEQDRLPARAMWGSYLVLQSPGGGEVLETPCGCWAGVSSPTSTLPHPSLSQPTSPNHFLPWRETNGTGHTDWDSHSFPSSHTCAFSFFCLTHLYSFSLFFFWKIISYVFLNSSSQTYRILYLKPGKITFYSAQCVFTSQNC